MGNITGISWTDSTLNFWIGCKKVSEGCKYCYMFRDMERYGRNPNVVSKVSDKTINKVLKDNTPRKIFVCSWSDFFIEDADQWREEAWEIIKNHPQHVFQILTKRPENIINRLPKDWNNGYDNVWLGITTENKERLFKRSMIFKDIPAKIKFLSCEPLLDQLFLKRNLVEPKQFNWIIIGGESGNKGKYRTTQIVWINNLIEEAEDFNIPIFFKQIGTGLADELSLKSRHGSNIEEWAPEWKIQEFPKNY